MQLFYQEYSQHFQAPAQQAPAPAAKSTRASDNPAALSQTVQQHQRRQQHHNSQHRQAHHQHQQSNYQAHQTNNHHQQQQHQPQPQTNASDTSSQRTTTPQQHPQQSSYPDHTVAHQVAMDSRLEQEALMLRYLQALMCSSAGLPANAEIAAATASANTGKMSGSANSEKADSHQAVKKKHHHHHHHHQQQQHQHQQISQSQNQPQLKHQSSAVYPAAILNPNEAAGCTRGTSTVATTAAGGNNSELESAAMTEYLAMLQAWSNLVPPGLNGRPNSGLGASLADPSLLAAAATAAAAYSSTSSCSSTSSSSSSSSTASTSSTASAAGLFGFLPPTGHIGNSGLLPELVGPSAGQVILPLQHPAVAAAAAAAAATGGLPLSHSPPQRLHNPPSKQPPVFQLP
ncbi:unnamed protein product [Protopolystoma xenopodis]|uniref:Uncharacterized protein n=1 Tax=Protopolystoma xenopodis TaxID=117903 RepID=A0A3S5CDK6_9PLAT|nr:unnamed protein product [Protopolystoma xenopodis]